MKRAAALAVAFAFVTLGLVALAPAEAVAIPDATVAIQPAGLREVVTTISPNERITWINASGTPVVRVVFDEIAGAPEQTGLFASSATRVFTHTGVYGYTALVGGRAWPIRGKIVVK
jgi:plastocyanin